MNHYSLGKSNKTPRTKLFKNIVFNFVNSKLLEVREIMYYIHRCYSNHVNILLFCINGGSMLK